MYKRQELAMVYEEINDAIKNIYKWCRRKKVKTPLAQFKASSYIYKEPYGNVLIIAPWNYPFQLVMSPLVGAIAAGNTVVIKPSELAPATAKDVYKRQTFDSWANYNYSSTKLQSRYIL